MIVSGLVAGVAVALALITTVLIVVDRTVVPAGITPPRSVSVAPATKPDGTVTPVMVADPPVIVPVKGGSPKAVQVGLPILYCDCPAT